MRPQLNLCLASNKEVWPIVDGTVTADGIDLNVMTVPAPELHWRQLRFAEYDASELGFRSLIARDPRWVGIPVFPNRRMFHTRILVRRDSGIETPADLKGRKVGVPSFWQSAVMWTLGALRDQYGVQARDMEYWMERNPKEWRESDANDGEAQIAPDGVVIHVIPHEDNIATLMLAKKLDAAIYYIGPDLGANIVERSNIDLRNHPEIRHLFPDPMAEGIRFYQASGIYPINHCVVVKRDIVDRYPWIPLNLFKAFQRANEIMTERRVHDAHYFVETGLISRDAGAALRDPIIKYGLAANRMVLQKYADYAFDYGSIREKVDVGTVFAPSTWET